MKPVKDPSELKVEIPFWYKPFIRFMPEFWEKLPIEEIGRYKARADRVPFSFVGTRYYGKLSKEYTSLQKAYLRARWKGLWLDFWTTWSEHGVQWVIVNQLNKEFVDDDH